MFKLLTLAMLTLAVFNAYAKVTVTTNGNRTLYDFTDISVKTENINIEGQSFIRAKLTGADDFKALHYKLGMPEIPVIRFYAPYGEVTIKFNNQKGFDFIKTLKGQLVPNLESLEKVPGSKRKIVMNKSFQKSNIYYPRQRYHVADAGTIRGKKQQLITVYPFSWNPSIKNYKLATDFSVTVTTANKSFTKNDGKPTFVFIVGREFKNSPSILKYENFKKKMGFKMVRINIEGNINSPEAIRSKLQEIYRNENLQYAIIFGDAEHVPSKRATAISGVTDHFYRAIDTDNYLNDINGPDIGVGRVTIKNETELANVVNKFIKYQTSNFSSEEWLGNVSFIATDDRYTVAEGSHNHAIESYMAPHGYMGVFPEAEQLGGDKLYAITYRVRNDQVVSSINLGRTIVNYSGHGATTYWAGPTVRQNDVRSLNHGDALPFVISNACITGQFTVSESFAETWIKHPNGAIMYWGSMDSTYWDEDDFLEKEMYKGIYELNYTEFSNITQNALKELWRIYGGENRSKYYWETYVTFGDPSIKLRTDYTQNINVSGPNALPAGIADLEYVLTYSDGTPLKNAIVSINKDDESVTTARTDENGKASLHLPIESVPGEYKVLIYGTNTRVIEKELVLTLADRPFIVLKNIRIAGQDDLRPTPFQQINFGLIAKNVARKATEGAFVEIAKIEGPATVIGSGRINLLAIGAEEEVIYDGEGLQIRIDDAANAEKIIVHFKWLTTEGEEGFSKVMLNVKRGISKVTSTDFGDILNPTSGGILPGGSGDVFITIKNTGDAPMENVTLYPEASSCILNVDGGLFIEKIAPGETIRTNDTLHVTLKPNCLNDDLAIINLVGSYGSCTQVDLNGSASFRIGRYGMASHEENLSVAIPDDSTLIYPFTVEGNVNVIKDIGIHIKITHPYIGDITINLVHPDGTSIRLRNQQGTSQHDLDEVYGMDGTEISALSNLNGKQMDGEWKLVIEDKAARDEGSLTYLKVRIKGLID